MQQNEIAVVVPVYNTGEKKLKRCIQSILNQTFQKFSLILVDDGSKDDSGAICDRFAEKDTRVTVIHQENSGSLAARNAGILSTQAQNSRYICMCDSDDILPRDAFKTLYSAAVRNEADFVCGRTAKCILGG